MPTDDQNAELLLARWNATLPRQQELGENLISSVQRAASALPHHQTLASCADHDRPAG